MKEITWLPHQIEVLDHLEKYDHAGVFLDMGLGKTFIGAEMVYFNAGEEGKNLLVCPISGIDMWLDHFKEFYGDDFDIYNLRDPQQYIQFTSTNAVIYPYIGIVNYDLVFRRKELSKMRFNCVCLDESSIIKNSAWKKLSKRAEFFIDLEQSDHAPKHWVELSGTPTDGKYEKLVSQVNLLGWKIDEERFWKHYVDYEVEWDEGHPIVTVNGYKNTDRLKRKLAEIGCVFMKSEDVLDLPKQNDVWHYTQASPEYRKFRSQELVEMPDGEEIVGDTTLKKLLYSRMLCGHKSLFKLDMMRDILDSTSKRLIVFYSFNGELEALMKLCVEYERPISQYNGHMKALYSYENHDNSVTLVQYQSGSKLLNLQLANQIVYFTPPLSSEDFEQSKKRIHRIGQEQPCFYHYLVCKGTIEESIYERLALLKDYTDDLFENESR